jgi:hypothetical protein
VRLAHRAGHGGQRRIRWQGAWPVVGLARPRGATPAASLSLGLDALARVAARRGELAGELLPKTGRPSARSDSMVSGE